jgi:hypothetical protein
MRRKASDAAIWAETEFGDAALGDARRTARLVAMLAGAAESPSGRLSAVYSGKELDAAYDFVENANVPIARLEEAIGRATARRCGERRIRVAIDGSSLTLTKRQVGREKGFGPIGMLKAHAQGLKVVSSLAMDDEGVPLGLLAQSWWARPYAEPRTRKESKRDRAKKKPAQKETARWLEVLQRSADRLQAVGALGWFQLDREADAWPILLALAGNGHWFTVRSSWDRLLAGAGDKQYLRARMAKTNPIGGYEVDVPEQGRREARRARMLIHVARVTLLLREKQNGKKPHPLELNVVWAHEHRAPQGVPPLNWMLLTNAPHASITDALNVVDGYTMRWRIEEFHRSWKRGSCEVECTQLRSRDAVVRWATILAVVAARVERIKRLGREQPERPASDELSEVEIEVLIALKRRIKKRSEVIDDRMPTMGEASRWLADIGGYTGPWSGGPPGSTTIRRGLERVQMGAEAVLALRE